MTFPSQTTPEFWALYRTLPQEVRDIARKNYRLWSLFPFHPSLRFKKIGGNKWSVRLGREHRAVGAFEADAFVWVWIGNHADYDRLG